MLTELKDNEMLCYPKRDDLINKEYNPLFPHTVFHVSPELPDFNINANSNVYFCDAKATINGDGSIEKPFCDIQFAVSSLNEGDTLYLRSGVFYVDKSVFIYHKNGGENKITISSYGNELAVIDGHGYDSDTDGFSHENGIFTVCESSDIVIKNIGFRNSHCKGIQICNSSRVDVKFCLIENTFACGISVWDVNPREKKSNAYKGFRIIGNAVRKANTWDMIPKGYKMEGEPPHEAISIAGANEFEIAFNHVYECDKEGIDVKENSINGIVHYNSIHHCDRQGLYADAWFGELKNVKFEYNTSAFNRGAGLALSVEGEDSNLYGVEYSHNIVLSNWGTGCFISKWGSDLSREDITISNNAVISNGHGPVHNSDSIFWITGGIFFYSANIKNARIENNILSDNATFEIAFSSEWGETVNDVITGIKEKNIVINNNTIDHKSDSVQTKVGWQDNYTLATPYDGDNTMYTSFDFQSENKRPY